MIHLYSTRLSIVIGGLFVTLMIVAWLASIDYTSDLDEIILHQKIIIDLLNSTNVIIGGR